MDKKILVAPSILSADFSAMGDAIKKISKADMIHCDVMDGMFVPNISFGPKMIADIRKHTTLPLDVHLMIESPERYIKEFAKAGADYITVHYETCIDRSNEVLSAIRDLGCKSGIVINPRTPIETIYNLLEHCDMVLLMSVQPGFGGQSFIEPVLEKLRLARQAIDKTGRNILLEIDGGINEYYAPLAVKNGADVLVAGSYVYGSKDIDKTIKELQDLKA